MKTATALAPAFQQGAANDPEPFIPGIEVSELDADLCPVFFELLGAEPHHQVVQ